MPFGSYFLVPATCLTVTGDKAAQLLHGQFTNSITDLKPGNGNYNLLLTNKGKILANLFIVNHGSDFLLVIPQEHATRIEEHLKKFAPLSRCAVENREADFSVLHVVNATTDFFSGCTAKNIFSYSNKRLGTSGCDVIFPHEDLSTLEAFLQKQSATKMMDSEVEMLRIKNGVCRIGIDATEENLPQEARLDSTLHFNKGCYLGQEVIARLHFRGHVNKILCCFESLERNISSGEDILDADKVVGHITSAVFDESEQKSYALGYVPFVLKIDGKKFLTGTQKVPLTLNIKEMIL